MSPLSVSMVYVVLSFPKRLTPKTASEKLPEREAFPSLYRRLQPSRSLPRSPSKGSVSGVSASLLHGESRISRLPQPRPRRF
jgi:hypothetical protein